MCKMVRKIRMRFAFFQCRECEHVYKDRALAEKCENHCKTYHVCNREITKQGIPICKEEN